MSTLYILKVIFLGESDTMSEYVEICFLYNFLPLTIKISRLGPRLLWHKIVLDVKYF